MKNHKTMNRVCIAILPLPAQGHLNQLLHLALRLSSRSIPVHYIGSSTHNRQARDRSTGPISTEAHFLHFHDIQLPPFESPPPDPNSSSNFPSHLQPAFTASLQLLTPLHSLLLNLSSDYTRVVLIHDSAMSFSTAVASSVPKVESYAFHTVSAYAILSFLNNVGFEDCFTPEFTDYIASQHRMTVKDHGRLFNTCRFLEHDSISKLESKPTWKDQKVFCLGPLNPVNYHNTTKQQQQRHECLAWLDKQPRNSVLYISFGTTTTLSERQIRELEHGIKATGKRFLWVLRQADRGNIYVDDGHSKGCQDSEIVGNGMVHRGWVPQLEVLRHEATGGFMSHCGWNSCMESMSNGVPMMAWPMHSDQPNNARLVTEVLGIGVGMREWERRNEVIGGDEIKGKILKLMGDGDDEGREVRKKAEEIGEKVRECGMHSREFDSFAEYLTR